MNINMQQILVGWMIFSITLSNTLLHVYIMTGSALVYVYSLCVIYVTFVLSWQRGG